MACWLMMACPAVALSQPHPDRSQYPANPSQWIGPNLEFKQGEGFPGGLMAVTEEKAHLKGVRFSQGTIEFDMKPLDFADTGVIFHKRDDANAEFVYLRADPDCPAADDCVQYAPIVNDRMQWNAYPKYQTGTQIADKGWNHLRIVVSGTRMRLYVNHQISPALDVPKLLGFDGDGAIDLKGPALFANFTISPGDRGDDAPPPTQPDVPGTIRRWSLGPTTDALNGRVPAAPDAPRSGWTSLATETDGELDLARFIAHDAAKTPRVAWLRTHVVAAEAGERTLDIGFVSRAWLFVNGDPVFSGENFYYPSADRRPDRRGRLSFDNGRVRVMLKKGDNEILVATDDIWRRNDGVLRPDYYGWAIEARFEDEAGLSLPG